MARADQILNLIKAGARGDHAQLRKTVEAMAADERAKNHTVLADRLLKHLDANGNGRPPTPGLRAGGFEPSALLADVTPKKLLEQLVLPKDVEQVVREIVEEQTRADLLRSYNLEPRHRILLAGPPGNGKTSLAEGIAHSMAVPFLVVRYESVIGSYLGETAQRIAKVFETARSRHCVLFFDEFDAIGKERGDLHETGEIKRVVNSLLLQIDDLPSHVVVIAASNHPELLDRAAWRRFQARLHLPAPTRRQVEKWFRQFEERTGVKLGASPRTLAEKLAGLSFAEVEDFGLDVLRRIALSQPGANPRQVVEQRLRQWSRRFQLKKPKRRTGDK